MKKKKGKSRLCSEVFIYISLFPEFILANIICVSCQLR